MKKCKILQDNFEICNEPAIVKFDDFYGYVCEKCYKEMIDNKARKKDKIINKLLN